MIEIKKKRFCYICSPYKGSALKRIRNIRYAREITERAINAGFIPITPRLYLPQVLNDKIPEERQKGLQIGQELLNVCEIVFIGERYGISAGMATEIELAKKSNKQIWRFDNDR